MRRLLVSLIVLLAFATTANATDYYFTSAGSDANSCLTGAKCKTLSKLQSKLSVAAAGDTFNLNRGETFTGGVTLPAHMNGSAALPITIGNYGSGALPIIDGGGTSAACFYARATGSGGTPIFSHITIDGLECKNTTRYGVVFYQNAGGSYGMPGIVVQNMDIHDTGPATDDGNYRNQLMFLDENKKADGVRFLNNRVGACGGHNCIQIQKDTGSPVVSGNYCYGPWNHNCVDLKSVVGATVTDNIVDGTGASTGACFYNENVEIPADDVTFTMNQCYAAPNGFECEIGGNFPASSTTCLIYNNTVSLGTNTAIATGGDSVCGNVTLDVRNNIFDTSSLYYDGHSCTTPTWDYNDDGATHGPPSTPRGAHDLVGVNPLWFNAAARNYLLTAASSCVNAGLLGLTTNPNMGSELSLGPTPSATPTATSTPVGTGTPTKTPTITPTPTITATATATVTVTRTPTVTATATATPVGGPAADSANFGQGPGVIAKYIPVPICTTGNASRYSAHNIWTCAPIPATPTPTATVTTTPSATPTALVDTYLAGQGIGNHAAFNGPFTNCPYGSAYSTSSHNLVCAPTPTVTPTLTATPSATPTALVDTVHQGEGIGVRPTWHSLANCPNGIAYSTSTHAWSCAPTPTATVTATATPSATPTALADTVFQGEGVGISASFHALANCPSGIAYSTASHAWSCAPTPTATVTATPTTSATPTATATVTATPSATPTPFLNRTVCGTRWTCLSQGAFERQACGVLDGTAAYSARWTCLSTLNVQRDTDGYECGLRWGCLSR